MHAHALFPATVRPPTSLLLWDQVDDFFAELRKRRPLILGTVRALQKHAGVRSKPKSACNSPAAAATSSAAATSATPPTAAAAAADPEADSKERLHFRARVSELSILTCLVFPADISPNDLDALNAARQMQACASSGEPRLSQEAKALSAFLLQNTSMLLPSFVMRLVPVDSDSSKGPPANPDGTRLFLSGQMLPTVLCWLSARNIASEHTVSLLETLACIWRRSVVADADPKVGWTGMENTVSAVSVLLLIHTEWPSCDYRASAAFTCVGCVTGGSVVASNSAVGATRGGGRVLRFSAGAA